MKEQLVSYKLAKLLKEKGFNTKTEKCYYPHEQIYRSHNRPVDFNYLWDVKFINTSNWASKESFFAPTLSLAAKWLREEHGRHIITIPTVTSDYTFKVIRVLCKKDFDKDGMVLVDTEQPPYKGVDASDYNTHEEALSKAIYETLDLI